jgi:hypothetical protein
VTAVKVRVVQPQPFREITLTCPESRSVLPGEVAGGVFAAAFVQQVLRIALNAVTRLSFPFTDR